VVDPAGLTVAAALGSRCADWLSALARDTEISHEKAPDHRN
jgi:hypothetical protein